MRIINKLSDSLRDELLLEANGPVIREIKLFSLNFSEDTLRQLISIMKEVRYTPGDQIFAKNDLSSALYILRRGEVELVLDRSHSCNDFTVLKKLHPGEIFGELSFFTNKVRSSSARSTDFTNVFMIKQQDFLEILQKNAKDFQRFCEIRDNIQIFDHYDDLFLRCFSCRAIDHQLKNCPLLHYIPKEDIIIQKFNYSQDQIRTSLPPATRPKKYNSRRKLEEIEKAAYRLQEEIFPRHETSSSEENEEEEEQEEGGEGGEGSINENIEENRTKKPSVSIDGMNHSSSLSEIAEQQENNNTELMKNGFDNRRVKRRKSRKKNYWKHENSKKSFSNQISQVSQKDLFAKFIKESIFMTATDPSQKKVSVAEDVFREKIENFMENFQKKPNISNNSNNLNNLNNLNSAQMNASFWKKDELSDLDKVKSFEDYFPHNNIETVLHTIETAKFKKLNKKIKKGNFLKSKYQLFLQNNLNINECIPLFLRGSTLYDRTKAISLKENLKKNAKMIESNNERGEPLTRRYYFKNSMNLQKLIAQEKFDPDKIKEYYRKKYMREGRRKVVYKAFKKFIGVGVEIIGRIGKWMRRRK